jgi:hypothetical protein
MPICSVVGQRAGSGGKRDEPDAAPAHASAHTIAATTDVRITRNDVVTGCFLATIAP